MAKRSSYFKATGKNKTSTFNSKVLVKNTYSGTSGSTSYEPVLFNTTLTGAGEVGGRARAFLTINSAAGGWTNALKGQVTYGASGRTTGLGSSICAEMTLSAGTTQGTYAPLEVELNIPSGAKQGTKTSFGYFSCQGTDYANFATSGYIFNFVGLGTAASSKIIQANTDQPTHALRIICDGTPYYLLMTTVNNGTEN